MFTLTLSVYLTALLLSMVILCWNWATVALPAVRSLFTHLYVCKDENGESALGGASTRTHTHTHTNTHTVTDGGSAAMN